MARAQEKGDGKYCVEYSVRWERRAHIVRYEWGRCEEHEAGSIFNACEPMRKEEENSYTECGPRETKYTKCEECRKADEDGRTN